MPTEVLAIGTTATDSEDVTVALGEELVAALKDDNAPTVAANALVDVQLKDDDGRYFNIDVMDSSRPALVLTGGATYRFHRRDGGSCGVFSA